ncbi:Uu.00g059940.m01.CDS01 [Anthostomella pinea]|uniref:Carboxylic ester hydrolase n=1 Tax=Anthostomella pinea TaxID=933095 RepID=A0AAI8VT00_9PEZI|nr:Uu.00g059940.m01.CDS01 [Anthostomella pinea]
MLPEIVALAVFSAFGADAAPSPKTLNSTITLLVDNDLQGADSPAPSSGVVLLEARSLADAINSCHALGEQLWSPESAAVNIQSNLNYIKFADLAQGYSQFWIASTNSTPRCIDINGQTALANSSLWLPVLCSQTAPFSNETFQDASEKWQVTLQSNNEYITGFRDRYSFRFLGVRYAPQPKRFTYSAPYTGNGSEVSATGYASECAQVVYSYIGSEDCLFVNIWTSYLPRPQSLGTKLRPVMFWIYGGGWTIGSINDATFDGGNMASRGDVVVVAINYRLSTLGFLALDDGVTNGNYALADQINALNWVRKNIKDFGGDPDKITIFGQSAGAGSVRALIASPEAIGKFAGAIPVSNLGGLNYGTTYSEYLTIEEEMVDAGDAILASTNCTTATSQVDCLRAIPADTLLSLDDVARYLVMDGTYLTSDELQLNGSALPVHLMIGTTRDDGGPIIGFPATTNQSMYLASQGWAVPPADLFPVPSTANQTLALFNSSTRLATDGMFRCIDQATVYAGLQNDRFGPVFFYQFNRTYQTTGWPGLDVCEPPKTADHPNGDPSGEYFKCHSGDLYLIFGNLAREGLPMRDENDLPFEQFVLDSFSSFARTFDPNPDFGYLAARGYIETLEELTSFGSWKPSTKNGMTLRTLQWPTVQGSFEELEQCEALGLGLDYYLR